MMANSEKTQIAAAAVDNTQHKEYFEEQDIAIDVNINDAHDPVEIRRITRKIDYRLLPILTILYLLSFLDRGNSESVPNKKSLRYADQASF